MSRNELKSDTLDQGKIKINWRDFTSAIGLVVLIIVSGIISKDFLTAINFVNVLKQAVIPLCLAIGMTFAILTGGIDLSVGSVIALLASVAGMLLKANVNWILTTLIILAIGFILGAIHGFLITKLHVPPFIATLAGFTMYKGLALLITDASSVRIVEPVFLNISKGNLPVDITIIIFAFFALFIIVQTTMKLRKKENLFKVLLGGILKIAALVVFAIVFSSYGGLPYMICISIILYAIFSFILSGTIFGVEIYAIGGNQQAAFLAGINVHKRIITVYGITSLLTAFGALLTASRLGSGAPQSGLHAELDAIAAVIIGGTSMTGGIGKLSGTVLGVLLIAVLNNMLSLVGATSYTQQITKGAIILIAVLIDMQLSRGRG
jgi:ribose/xylose/arabinose/galactoside ABC-type transport system permease subunit